MGTAVIGGLTVSTVLTLVLVPVVYCVFAGVGIVRSRKKNANKVATAALNEWK
jgi:HAE1 family hydrophobic/amphiphilic exporter-1